MRVLSLFPRLDPTGGGLQSGGLNMTVASARAGVDHLVGCSERPEARERAQVMVERLGAVGVPTITFPPPRGIPSRIANEWNVSPRQPPWILRHCSEFDLLHVHGTWNLGSVSALAAARICGVPLVVTPHESMTRTDIDASRSAARRAQKMALRAAYLRWGTLFVITSALETTESTIDGVAHATIPYPVYDELRPLPQMRPRGRQATLTIGFLGRIAPKKNLEVVIEALAQLPPHIRLLIAGDGAEPLVARARDAVRRHDLSDRVTFLGFVPPADRDDFLARVDVLAMPSEFESFGMSAAEAMIAGVPLVVSRRTGISEVIRRQGGGVTIDPNSRSLAAAIAGLDSDREHIVRLSAQAQAAIATELNFRAIGTRLREAYERALELHRSP